MKVTDLRNTKHVSVAKLNELFDLVKAEYETIAFRLNEALSPVDGDLGEQLEILSKRFEAAKRGLGIVNRLAAGPQKTEHARRVMSNLNSIRAMLTRVTRNLEDYERAERDYTNTDDLGSQMQVLPRNTFQPQPQAVEQNEETTEPRQGWAHNTLARIIRTKDGMCPACNCEPCECSDENEEYCPDCDGTHQENEESINPEMRKAANSKVVKNANLKSPFDFQDEDRMNQDPSKFRYHKGRRDHEWQKHLTGAENEEENGVCGQCGWSPCECAFGSMKSAASNSKELKDWNLKNPFEEEERSACAHCKSDPCECAHEEECPYCHETICKC